MSRVIIVDSSVLSVEPGTRIVEMFDMVEDFAENPIFGGLNDEELKADIRYFCNNAEIGQFKDFGVYTVFIGKLP